MIRALAASLLLAAVIMVPAVSAQERVLQVVSPREITSLEARDTGFHFRRLRVAETLVTLDQEGNLAGELAESWSVDPDGLTWRFMLRPNVKFHDGTDASPNVVLAELERVFQTSEVFSTAPIESFAVNGRMLVIKLKTPFSLLPASLTDATAIILAPGSYGTDGHVTQIIGTGPYRIVTMEGRTSISMEAFPDYWGPQPAIPHIAFTGATGADTLANMAESGQADLIFMMPIAMRDRVDASGRAEVITAQTARMMGLTINAADIRFSDLRVRQAVSLAIDRQGIATAIFRNPDAVANQLFSPAFPHWFDPDRAAPVQDVEKAKALLADAGWTPDTDGVLTKDGTRFSFTIVVGPAPELASFSEALQAQLKEVGIEVLLETGPYSAILDQVKNGTYFASASRRTYGMLPDPVGTLLVDYSLANVDTAIWGGIGYRNPDLDAAFDAYLSATDDAAIAAARTTIDTIVNDDLPVIPVVWYDYGVAVSNGIDKDSVTVDPLEFSFWLDTVRWAE